MPRLPMPPLARAALALGLAWTLAGCSHTIRVGGSRTLRVAVSEYRVTPDPIRAYAGTLTLTVRNLGVRTHDLAITLSGHDVAQSPDLVPGQTATMTVNLAPGKYMLRSTITGDQALGLWGTLDVVATHRT
ncbi:MAG TPA: cupredoxin domain-containing protein [Solirubrobacteraceae bacterium]|nr:cupredoxin domain-containing protein [Solirubrobacteraceae bacterium]